MPIWEWNRESFSRRLLLPSFIDAGLSIRALSVGHQIAPQRSLFQFGILGGVCGFLSNPLEDLHAEPQLRRGNLIQQFMSQFGRGGIDLRDGVSSSLAKMDGLATAIVGDRFSDHPTGPLEAMQQVDQSRFLDPEPGGDLGLGKRAFCNRQVQQCPPLSLAKADWSQTLIKLETPGTSDAMEKRTKGFDIA